MDARKCKSYKSLARNEEKFQGLDAKVDYSFGVEYREIGLWLSFCSLSNFSLEPTDISAHFSWKPLPEEQFLYWNFGGEYIEKFRMFWYFWLNILIEIHNVLNFNFRVLFKFYWRYFKHCIISKVLKKIEYRIRDLNVIK